MAAEAVHGKVYAFILLADGSFNSRPLMAGMVKLDPSDGVTYKRLEAAAALNGHRFWRSVTNSPVVFIKRAIIASVKFPK